MEKTHLPVGSPFSLAINQLIFLKKETMNARVFLIICVRIEWNQKTFVLKIPIYFIHFKWWVELYMQFLFHLSFINNHLPPIVVHIFWVYVGEIFKLGIHTCWRASLINLKHIAISHFYGHILKYCPSLLHCNIVVPR